MALWREHRAVETPVQIIIIITIIGSPTCDASKLSVANFQRSPDLVDRRPVATRLQLMSN